MTRAKDISKILTDADISGNIDVDGVTNLDVVDIDGAVDMASTLNVTGAITSSAGATITTADNTAQLTLKSTDADASSAPILELTRDSASPADGDSVGEIVFKADDDGGNSTEFASIQTKISDASDGAESGKIEISTIVSGTSRKMINIKSNEVAINDDSIDVDFRVESNSNANMLFVDGENDRVGIGTATFGAASHKLEVDGGSAETRLRISSTGTDLREAGIILANSSKSAANDGIVIAHGGAATTFDDLGGNELIRIAQSSNKPKVGIGTNNPNSELHVEGAANPVSFIRQTSTADDAGVIYRHDRSTGGQQGRHLSFTQTNGTEVGSISAHGSATFFNTSSDYRLKDNISYSFDATSRLKQLKPCQFNFKTNTNTTVDGFLAHEVSSVVPEAINGEKDATRDIGTIKDEDNNLIKEDAYEHEKKENQTWTKTGTENIYQSIDQSKLIPLLTKTILELEARITALESA